MIGCLSKIIESLIRKNGLWPIAGKFRSLRNTSWWNGLECIFPRLYLEYVILRQHVRNSEWNLPRSWSNIVKQVIYNFLKF